MNSSQIQNGGNDIVPPIPQSLIQTGHNHLLQDDNSSNQIVGLSQNDLGSMDGWDIAKKGNDASPIHTQTTKSNIVGRQGSGSGPRSPEKQNLKDMNSKQSRTINAAKDAILNIFTQKNGQDLKSTNLNNFSLRDLQKRITASQQQQIRLAEIQEMKELNQKIWNERNFMKLESSNLGSGRDLGPPPSLALLIQKSIRDDLDNRQKEIGINRKKRYLSAKTRERENEMPDFMLRFNDNRKIWWDGLILLLAIWNCFFIPFDVAFEPDTVLGIEILNSFIDLMFYIDIIFSFRVTEMTLEGHEITDQKRLAIRYIFQGTFILDLLSVIPFNQMIPGDQKILDILGILKLVRLSRLPKLIQKINIKKEQKAILQVFQVIIFMIFYFHFQACFWFFVVKQHEIWIPPPDLGSAATNVYLYETDILWKYATCFHLSVMTLTGNEQAPRTDIEIAVASFMILLAYLANANIFGQMAALVQAIREKSQYFQQQIDIANTAMKNIMLPTKIQNDIRNYLILTQSTLDQQLELDKFLNLISPSLKLKVSWQLFDEVIRTNRVFKMVQVNSHNVDSSLHLGEGSDLVSVIVRKLFIQLNGPEDIIIHQGEDTQDIYIVTKGDTLVSIKDTTKKNYVNFKTLTRGDHFGELSLLYGCPRTATISAANYCTFAKLTPENYKILQTELPEVEECFRYFSLSYDDKMKNWLSKTLQRLPFFVEIEPQCFHKILYSMTRRSLDKGAYLYKTDADVDHLRVVQEGCIDIITIFEGKEFVLEHCHRSSILNPRSFFVDENSFVYARASKNSVVLEISINTLNTFLKSYPIFEKKFLSHQLKILNSARIFPIDYDYKLPKKLAAEKCLDIKLMQRVQHMKLIVMRRILEIRIQRSKPKLQDLLKQLSKGNPMKKLEVKRQIIQLYDDDEQGGLSQLAGAVDQDLERFMEPGDFQEQNQTYLKLKLRIKRAIARQEEQEAKMEEMKNNVQRVLSSLILSK